MYVETLHVAKKDYCIEYLLTEQIDILHAKLLGFESKWVYTK